MSDNETEADSEMMEERMPYENVEALLEFVETEFPVEKCAKKTSVGVKKTSIGLKKTSVGVKKTSVGVKKSTKLKTNKPQKFTAEEKTLLATKIKSFPEIWDLTNKLHQNNNAVNQSWTKIAEDLDKPGKVSLITHC